jgi:hypothetical protein
MITIYKDRHSSDAKYIKIATALDRIKDGASKEIIERVRNPVDATSKDRDKSLLPAVVFSGKCGKSRKKVDFLEHSGLVSLDFDHLENTPDFMAELTQDEYIYAAWVSPSGDGIKALVMTEATNIENHYAYWEALRMRYPDIDESCKDPTRVCYESYDSNIYINTESKVWTTVAVEPPLVPLMSNKSRYPNFNKIRTPLNMIANSVDGEKYVVLRNASILMGGYIAANHIDEARGEQMLLDEISKKGNVSQIGKAKQAIADGIAYGKQKPIYELEQEVAEHEAPSEKMWFMLNDVKDELDELYENGVQSGFHTGYRELDKHYTVRLGCTTYLYGSPYSGKTQFWFQVLVNMSRKHKMNHLVYSPEGGNAVDVFAELIEAAAGGDYTDTFGRRITAKKKEEATNFVGRHFIVLDPKDVGMTVHNFLDIVTDVERVTGHKIHTVTADPFNEFMTASKEARQDLYIEEILSEVRKNARAFNRHICIITHVRDQQMIVEKGLRYYPMATPREIAGGQAWYRKGQAMISVWRPPVGLEYNSDNALTRGEYRQNDTVIAVQKAKPKGIGKVGEVLFSYDIDSKTYTDMYGKPDITKKEEVETTKYSEHEQDIYPNVEEPPF